MPIAAISEDAAQAICSSLVLNNATSVIKELIDNALDSQATNIVIEISANTLDIIQVKDNGIGIGIEDRQLLCKRGYTSKIRTLEDLARLGGTFLGFRGEALASIAELSHCVTITTRIDGETVGTQLKYDRKGKLTSSSSASHGTGTTVRTAEFLNNIPVRKQTAQKQALKTLASIKSLLFDYAFARPKVRFHFKVLKSKSDLKENWSYAPCKDTNDLVLVASKIVGTAVAAQCQQESIASDDREYAIDALLLKPQADLSKSGGNSRFFSIDARPLAADCGTMKELHKVYKFYLQSTLCDSPQQAGSQFLLLRLHCPGDAYDVNVEPAKNEVLFQDPHKVIQLFEEICKRAYGEKSAQQVANHPNRDKKLTLAPLSFDSLLAKGDGPSMMHHNELRTDDDDTLPVRSGAGLPRQQDSRESITRHPAKIYEKTYDCADDDVSLDTNRIEECPIEPGNNEAEDVMHPCVTNPFVLARMSSRIGPRDLTEPSGDDKPEPVNHGQTEGIRISRSYPSPSHGNLPIAVSGVLPSPSTSPERDHPYQNPGPPNRPWRVRNPPEDDEQSPISSPMPSAPAQCVSEHTLLEHWAQNINSSVSVESCNKSTHVRKSDAVQLSATGSNESHFHSPVKQRETPKTGQQSKFRTPFKRTTDGHSESSNRQGQILNPYITPQSASKKLCSSPQSITQKAGPHWTSFARLLQNPETELDDIMDFEHRKRETILQNRGKTRQARPSIPHPNNEEAASISRSSAMPARFQNWQPTSTPSDDNMNYGSRLTPIDVGAQEEVIPPQPNSSSYTQNPHFNRYRKALRNLDSATTHGVDRSESAPIHVGEEQAGSVSALEAKYAGTHWQNLLPNDARGYLIQHHDSSTGDSKTGKPKRSHISNLPLEDIILEEATFPLVGILRGSQSVNKCQLVHSALVLGATDPYVRTGAIVPAEVVAIVDTEEAEAYKNKARELLKGLSTVELFEDVTAARIDDTTSFT